MHLFDLIDLDPEKCKIHLAVTPPENPNSNPLDAFYKDEFQDWQEFQRKRNFGRQYIVSLIRCEGDDKWLFAGVWIVNGEPPPEQIDDKGRPYFLYKTELTNYIREMIGRLVVRHELEARNVYRDAETIYDRLEVFEIHRPQEDWIVH